MLSDSVGNSAMTSSQILYTYDRTGKSNSALNMNKGTPGVPSGTYFNSNFTISVWIKANTLSQWIRILDFRTDTQSVYSK